jgi:hypothetical protein
MALAADVEHFLTYESVGRHLMERAIQDRADALEELAEVPAHETNEVIRLQWKAKMPQMFMTWLNEALAGGVAAEHMDAAENAAKLEGYR